MSGIHQGGKVGGGGHRRWRLGGGQHAERAQLLDSETLAQVPREPRQAYPAPAIAEVDFIQFESREGRMLAEGADVASQGRAGRGPGLWMRMRRDLGRAYEKFHSFTFQSVGLVAQAARVVVPRALALAPAPDLEGRVPCRPQLGRLVARQADRPAHGRTKPRIVNLGWQEFEAPAFRGAPVSNSAFVREPALRPALGRHGPLFELRIEVACEQRHLAGRRGGRTSGRQTKSRGRGSDKCARAHAI